MDSYLHFNYFVLRIKSLENAMTLILKVIWILGQEAKVKEASSSFGWELEYYSKVEEMIIKHTVSLAA